MEMEASGGGGGALTSVLYAAISVPCALVLLVVGDVGLRVATLALRGEYAWPTRNAMLGYRVTRPVFNGGGIDGGQAAYDPSAFPDDDDDDDEPPPLLPAELCDRLAVAVYRRGEGKAQQDPDCAFCLSAVGDGAEVRELRCRHVFHRACLDAWLVRPRATCPLCRDRLLLPPTTDTDYDYDYFSSPSAPASDGGALWHMT